MRTALSVLALALALLGGLGGCGGDDRPACVGDTCSAAEDCVAPGDEDGDGQADCADTDCANACMNARCGDGVVGPGEECDDGNSTEDDGCSACRVDDGFECAMTPSICTTVCGDGFVKGTETCDQGGGNVAPGDGCSAACQVEAGWICDGAPSTCCDGACQAAVGCDAGETPIIVTNTMPVAIPDLDTGWSSVTVSSNHVVSRVAVSVSVNSSVSADLTLIGPRGITRVLTSSVGPGSSSIRFEDSAARSIADSNSPHNGRFRPEQRISGSGGAGFRGQVASGSWTVRVRDQFHGLDWGTVLNRWSLILCTSTTLAPCGNGSVDPDEECDDGNNISGDACNNACGITDGCGNDVVEAGEDCDDDNQVSGDGCSATCTIEQHCPAGQVAVVVGESPQTAIPDANGTGATSTVTVATTGAVTSARVFVNAIVHTRDEDLDIVLESPRGIRRELSTDNGSSGDNYVRTLFDDSATTPITGGLPPPPTPPFTGRFRPEASMAVMAGVDVRRQPAAGAWVLRVADDQVGETGMIDGWKLLLCVDPAATTCGDGLINDLEECDDGNNVDTDACSNRCQLANGCGDDNIDAGEACDDGAVVPGDGCSATCQPEHACPAGQVAVLVSNNTPMAIPDNDLVNGVSSPVIVTEAGAVISAKVYLGRLTHFDTQHVRVYLDNATRSIRRKLTGDRGNWHYTRTIFDDTAATAIGSAGGASQYTGTFRPDESLSTSPGVDFRRLGAPGFWSLRVFDRAPGQTGTLETWSLLLCVDPLASFCGDSAVDAGEECDDGNHVDDDACSNQCGTGVGCGDGDLDAGEQCDDDNVVSGDGCSATCTLDIGCAAGEVPVIVHNTSPVTAPDANVTGAISTLAVATAGLVRKALVTVSVTHPVDADIDLYLLSPFGGQRVLASDLTGANYVKTTFSDAAAVAITAGVPAPFTGTYRPVETLGYFNGESAQGDWFLRIADDGTAGTTGSLDSWSLALCIDPSMPRRCGNGVVESPEQCDDTNAVGGDNCSMLCELELNCPVGQIPLVRTSNDERVLIPDTTPAGVTSHIDVAGAGTVARAIVAVNALGHTFDDDLDLTLIAPNGTAVVLSSDNGASGNDYLATIFNDSAGQAIMGADSNANAPPFRGLWRPEDNLAAVNGQAAAGTWRLKIVDDATDNAGMFRTWSIGLCVAP